MDSLNELLISGPEWAGGCESCQYGLAVATEPIGILLLHEQRAIEANEDLLLFCTCRAAHMYRQYLRKVYAKIELQTRYNIYQIITAAHMPTVHFVAAVHEVEPTP